MSRVETAERPGGMTPEGSDRRAAILRQPVFPPQVKREQWWRWPGTTGLMVGEYNKLLLALLRRPLGWLLPAGPVRSPLVPATGDEIAQLRLDFAAAGLDLPG